MREGAAETMGKGYAMEDKWFFYLTLFLVFLAAGTSYPKKRHGASFQTAGFIGAQRDYR